MFLHQTRLTAQTVWRFSGTEGLSRHMQDKGALKQGSFALTKQKPKPSPSLAPATHFRHKADLTLFEVLGFGQTLMLDLLNSLSPDCFISE